MRFATVVKRGKFDSAHKNTGFPEGHKCRNIHGHEFKYELHVKAPIDEETGLSIDFGIIKDLMKPLEDKFDHAYLNELSFFKRKQPTAENIAHTIFDYMDIALKSYLPESKKYRISLQKVILQETENSSVIVRREDRE